MTVTQLKSQLHTIIDKMEDVDFLKSILSFTQRKIDTKENYKKLIELGEADIQAGKTHTQNEVENYFKKKLTDRNA